MNISIEPMLTTLALSTTSRILIGVMAIIVLVIGGGIVVVFFRRRYHDLESEELQSQSLSLHHLRRMQSLGHLSDEEFERLKQVTVQSLQSQSGAKPSVSPASGGVQAGLGLDLTGEPLPKPPQSPLEDSGENTSGPDAGPNPDA